MKITHKFKLIAGTGLLVAGLMAGACRSERAAPPPAIPEVAVITVNPERVVLTTELPGRASAYLIAEIRPQVNGIIQKRLFEEGSDVTAGKVLYQIDPAPFKAAYDSATANLSGMRKSADRARAGLEASIAAVVRQQASVQLTRTNRWRYEELFKKNVISALQRDQAVADADMSEATLRTNEAQVKNDQEAVAVAESNIRQSEAALETARINLAYTQILAPITGRIGKSNVTVGALVTGQQSLTLTTIQQLDPIYVDVPQSSADLLNLRRRVEEGRLHNSGEGQSKVRLILEDGTTYYQEGTLQFRDVTVEPGTGSVTLRVIVPNPKAHLLPGMFIRAVVREGVNHEAILIPQQAVSRDPTGNAFALTVDAQGRVVQRTLMLDRAIGDRWLIASGLAQGDRVIVEGLQKVRPGAAVKVVTLEDAGKTGGAPKKTAQPASKAN
jgi:membrane fusion protein, multidrug efflux system